MESIMNEPPLKIANYVRIGNVIPRNAVSVVVGLPSAGKTYSLIKFMNLNGITPIHINLDETPVADCLAAHSIEGKCLLKLGEYTDLADTVILIDTYQLAVEMWELREDDKKDQRTIVNRLTEIAKTRKCTIVVIGHSEDFASKDGIFTANPLLIRSSAEHLVMVSKQTAKVKDNEVHYSTTIRKGRNNGGTRIIDNWMREQVINPLTGKLC